MGIEGSAVAWKPQPALHLTVRERLHNRRDAGGGGTGRVGRGGARPGPPFRISLLTTSDNVQAVRPPRPLASSPPPPASLGVVQTFPNDPLYPWQAWHYGMIDAPRAWAITTGNPTVL